VPDCGPRPAKSIVGDRGQETIPPGRVELATQTVTVLVARDLSPMRGAPTRDRSPAR
jgi:hypothetical protein